MTRATLVLILLLTAVPASAQLQGTLFTSPQQREYLDFLRQEHLARNRERGFDINEVVIPQLPGEVEEAGPPPEPVIYRLGGIMNRSDGSYSIWLNGRSLDEGSLPGEARLVREGRTLALRFATPQGAVTLRPGQTLNFDLGEVLENYQANGAAAAATEVVEDTASAEVKTETAPEAASGPDTTSATPATDTPTEGAASPDNSDPAVLPDSEQLEALATEMNMSPEALQALLLDMQAAAARVATESGDGQ